MNGEHLSPKTRELLDKPIEERIAHIQKDSWIPYSQANKILQQLEDAAHETCQWQFADFRSENSPHPFHYRQQ